MATSTNYGWAEPDNSSLVKNGAQDIRTLGNAIDAFLFRPFTRNAIINGGFDIWQRGTSSSTSGWTCADRWYNIASGTTTFSQDTSVPTNQGVQYSYKWTTGASSSYGQYYTAFDSATIKPLRGQGMVFSFWVKTTGTAFTGLLNADVAYSTSTDAYASQTVAVTITGATNITPTSTWTKYSGTLTIPSDASGLKIGVIPTAVQASGVVVYLAAVQLEVGSTATPFNRAGGTIQGELAACQRYFQTITGGTTTGINSTSSVAFNAVFPPMRTSSITFALSGAVGITDVYTADFTQSSANITTNLNNGVNGAILSFGNFSGLTAYRNYSFRGNVNITASAEL